MDQIDLIKDKKKRSNSKKDSKAKEDNTFFQESKESSRIKSLIVSDYFDAWSSIIKKGNNKIAYIDFYSGPGAYEDGTESTPIKIIKKVLENKEKSKMLVCIFNDEDEKNLKNLEKHIYDLPNIKELKHKPIFNNETMETENEFVTIFSELKLVPTFFFIDPFGYKGLTLNLIKSVLKDWGCDGIFFFNYIRINMAISNPKVIEHMNQLFGYEAREELTDILKNSAIKPYEREEIIMEYMMNALENIGGHYVTAFRFLDDSQNRTSHFLIFVTKHRKGYDVIKRILAKYSNTRDIDEKFSFDPKMDSILPFKITNKYVKKLEKMLLKDFKKETLTMKKIYESHDLGKLKTRYFTEADYKMALLNLEKDQKIKTKNPNRRKRPEGTFGPKIIVSFP